MSEFRRGFHALDRGDHDEAASLLAAYASRHPSDWKARLWHARAAAEAGRVDEALGFLHTVAERRPHSAVPRSFAALILFDARRFPEAQEEARQANLQRRNALAQGIELLAGVWQGKPPPETMVRILQGANADLKGRALHLVETRRATLPKPVIRDVMDEVGIGWPGYRVPPPWFFKSGPERSVWRLLARGLSDDAFQEVCTWAGAPGAGKRATTMIAAAMCADRWDKAEAWAGMIPHYRAFIEGRPPRRGLNHFQVALFRGVCTLLRGDADGSMADLAQAAALDGTSYLPRYCAGRAGVALGRWHESRREFVAACERLNPALAVIRWKEFLRAI
ncbi:tetratricopeptide repeat protein [Candidatus Fermentibacteria bacterium]|nr:tetratricopeptide repeat protein [Candidatus Fermentibacteria bacterium]